MDIYRYSLLAVVITASSAHSETWSSLESPNGATNTSGNTPTEVVISSNSAPSPTSSSSQNSGMQLLYEELEALKQEVQMLRGKIEEQDNELKKLKTEQKERYIDLDRRVSQLITSNEAPILEVSEGAEVVSTDDKTRYGEAFKLLSGNKFPEAVAAFQEFLKQHPKSPLAVNAYYWLGQIYYKQANWNEARKAFTIVINQFPEHQKSVDSSYKLGVVLHQLGESLKAKKLLQDLVKKHSKSNPSTAKFAEDYLKSNF